ncbi:NAD-dependent epimerase/dehydratase family protein [Haloplanus halophilus]|uniref:NAD-dependent epimerase/dehydratase family protein n=1 Tax=Haloplanus halophilus TaxID=2949993 RepID=UPI00203D48A1|nr:NAD-dependent epimerase/dehydratase family protein [Haloplanus sp. GDY1]
MSADLPPTGRPGPRGRSVLVTGGAGFVGSHLVDALVDDNEVRVLDDLSNGSRAAVPDAATLVAGDVRDPETVARAAEGVDLVFHLAANVSVERSVAAPVESHRVNVDGTLHVLEAAREAGARVVFASSAAVYGDPPSVPVAESAPKAPSSPYGAEKLSADRYLRLYADRYGLETVSLRYFNVYGPGGLDTDYSGVIDVFLSRAREGRDLPVHGDGTQTRDFVHVADVVRANLLAAITDATGAAYNVGTGHSVTISRLADLVVDATDSPSDVVHTDPREGDVDESEADISRAREILGFEPRVSLREGLDHLVDDGASPRR